MSKDIVALEGADLAVGESMMTECPFCLAPERKFSITRYSDGLGYLCFRASCRKSGAVGKLFEIHATGTVVTTRKSFEPEHYTGPLSPPMPGDYAAELLGRIGLSCQDGERCYGIKSIRNGDGIYYPLWNLKGAQCGWHTRTRSKAIYTGRLLEARPYAWYAGGLGNMWIVEDPLSAIRLAEHVQVGIPNALALLGTILPDSIDLDFYRNYDRVYVALDPGAEEAARKIVKTLRTRGSDAVMVVLPDDIHRLDQPTFESLLENYS